MKFFSNSLSRSWPGRLGCALLLALSIKSRATIETVPLDPFRPIVPAKDLSRSEACSIQERERFLKEWQLKGVAQHAESSWIFLENRSGNWYRFKNNQVVDQYKVVAIQQGGVLLEPNKPLQTVCQESFFIPFGFQISEKEVTSIPVDSVISDPSNE